MGNDFIISRSGGRWKVVAMSDRGKAFAADHPRFNGNEADLDQAEALEVYQKIHTNGYFAGVPEGLPPPTGRLLYSRLAILLALILFPIMVFVLLI